MSVSLDSIGSVVLVLGLATVFVLDENQQAKQEAIGLPFRRGGAGGGGGPGGAPPDSDANPFTEIENSTAAKKLTERLKPVGE